MPKEILSGKMGSWGLSSQFIIIIIIKYEKLKMSHYTPQRRLGGEEV
jgi:hypothetical protein